MKHILYLMRMFNVLTYSWFKKIIKLLIELLLNIFHFYYHLSCMLLYCGLTVLVLSIYKKVMKAGKKRNCSRKANKHFMNF